MRVALTALAAISVLGIAMTAFIGTTMKRTLEDAAEVQGLTLTRDFAQVVLEPVLIEDVFETRHLMEHLMAGEPDVTYVFVVDGRGQAFASTFQSGVPLDLLSVNQPATGEEYSILQIEADGEPMLDIAVPLLGGHAGVAHVGLSEVGVYKVIADTRNALVAITAVAALFALLLAYGVGRVIARPLETLADTTAKVERGDLSVRAEVWGDVEARLLAHAFNAMLDTLEEDIARREAAEAALVQARDRLEVTVQERTEQLAAANEDLESANEELLSMNEELLAMNDELRDANRELERANEMVVEATKAKNEFLAAMSHELRTPLNSVIGFSSILSQGLAGSLNDEQQHQVGMVHTAGTHLLALINDALDLTRIERGRLEPHLGQVDIGDVARGAVESVKPLAEQKGLAVALVVDEVDTRVRSDARRVEQILLNLLGNAVKFTEEGHVAVAVTREGDEVVVAVEDSGIGIGDADLPHIFDEFYRVHRGDGSVVASTGLGLAVSDHLAAVLGASLRVESDLGRGSTFTLRLPVEGPPQVSSGDASGDSADSKQGA